MSYFNYWHYQAYSWWDRQTFLRKWFALYAPDGRWVPPPYPKLGQALKPPAGSHLARLHPVPIWLEAMPGKPASFDSKPSGYQQNRPMFEVPTGAVIVLPDERRRDQTAHLGLMHSVNDRYSLRQLLQFVAERMAEVGVFRYIGPTHLSPYLGYGLLCDSWDKSPPLHTLYNPPYLPEIVDQVMRPLEQRRLYHLPVDAARTTAVVTQPAPAQLIPLDPVRLTTDLLPLLQTATRNRHFPTIDALEAQFLINWCGVNNLTGWIAQIDGAPVGFVLLQPDNAPRLRRAGGGRKLLWRLWLLGMQNRPVKQGRLLFGAVATDWQRRGIGTQLLQQALTFAAEQTWHTLTVGPLNEKETAVALLQKFQAIPQQTYQLYEFSF